MERDPLRDLLATAPFGIALLDASLRYREVNDYLARVHGLPVEQHQGRTVREVVPQVAGELEVQARRVLDRGEAVEAVRLRCQAGGQERHWLISLHPVRDADGGTAGVGAVVLDVTESVRTSEQLDRRTTQQAVVARFGQRALAGAEVDVLREEAARIAAETLGVAFGEVLELCDDETLVVRAGVGWAEGVIGSRIHAGADTQAGTVVAERAPVVVENLAEERRFQAVAELRRHGIVSGASVPIQSQGVLHGVLAAHDTRPRRFSTDDVAFLQALANVLGAAIERAQVEARLRESAQRLHLALQAGRLGAWEWDLSTDRVHWSETLEAIYGLPAGGFSGTFDDYLARVHAEDRERVLRMVRDAVEDAATLPEFDHRIVRPDGSERWLRCSGGPVRRADGRLGGMLGLAMDVTERKLAEQERLRLLEAEHAARTQAEAARERLAFLARVTAALGTTLDVDELLDKVTALAVGGFADGCAVDLLEHGALRRPVAHHRDPVKSQAYRELRRLYPPRAGAGNVLLQVVETREPILVSRVSEAFQRDYAVDERHLELMRLVRARSLLCVPLVARDRVLGVLSFVRDEERPFDQDGLDLAQDVARRLALAIDNALLFRARAEGEARFRRLANTLQQSLLPPHLPEPAGLELAAAYRPAAKGLEVGGDFYDVFPLEGDHWGLVVGDVCGKGPEAAALTAFARYTLRAAAVQHRLPSRAVAALNQALLRDARHEPGRFLTLVFARLRPTGAGAELTLCLGGHPRPLVLRSGGTVEAVGEPGTLVGVMEEPSVSDAVVTLSPGDTLLCFTDGVTDVRRGAEPFGERRLERLAGACAGLAPEEVIERIERALEDFSGGIARDDVALVALRVPPR